jgi:WD40 repeat protein
MVLQDGSLLAYALPDGAQVTQPGLPFNSPNGTAFSPDLAWLAVGGNRSQVQIWQTAGGNLRATLEAERALLRGMAFSPDGQFLAAPAADQSVVVFRLSDAALQGVYPCPGPVWKVSYSPDGGLIAAFSAGNIYILQAGDGQLRYTLPGYAAAFAPDGASLAAAYGISDVSALRFYRAADGALLYEVPAVGGALAYAPDGKLLAVNSNRLEIRQTSDGSLLYSTASPADYAQPLFSSDGQLLALAAWDGVVHLFGAP